MKDEREIPPVFAEGKCLGRLKGLLHANEILGHFIFYFFINLQVYKSDLCLKATHLWRFQGSSKYMPSSLTFGLLKLLVLFLHFPSLCSALPSNVLL